MLFDDASKQQKYPIINEFTDYIKKPERKIIGRKTEMRSIWAAMQRPELCNVILIGEAGSGKALANGTMIPVAKSKIKSDTGYLPIEKLHIGDIVFDENGYETEVLGVFPQGLLDAYKITFSDSTNIICNDEHLWAARTKKQRKHNKPFKIYTLRHMLDEGLTIRKNNGKIKPNWSIPVNKAVKRRNLDTDIDFYAMGVYVGGCHGSNGLLGIEFADERTADNFAKSINAKAVKPDDNTSCWKFIKDNGWYVKEKDYFSDISSESGMIPDKYLNSSEFQRFELLRGIMDTSDTIIESHNKVCFTTNKRCLPDVMIKLLTSLGIRFDVNVNINDRDTHEFILHVSSKVIHKLFRHERMHNIINESMVYKNVNADSDKTDLSIVDITKLANQMPMTCIYVSSPSHLFQAGYNHIVTHNTMLVQGTRLKDEDRLYLEVNLSNMISTRGSEALPGTLESLFAEVMNYRKDEDTEIVLFIDEFHRIIQESPAAVEALKPLLADSGTRGIKIIAATTYIEFQQWISPNQPLVERLQRININQTDKDMTISILKNMTKTYNVDMYFYTDRLYELIYEYTNRYIPANSQPRKSILVLDNMIGWHKAEGRKFDLKLLADVIYQQEGINVAFRVDASKIKKELDEHVLSQQFATSVIEDRLQICVADLNDKSKPMSSFLFTGSTGVGKTEMCKQLAKILFEDDRRLIRFDMTEYANPDSIERFREELTARIWAMPYCILLLDEVEKACAPVTRLLLQVLDDGRLMDRNNREVVFTNCYIVLTTNAGSEIYKNIAQYNADDTGSGSFVGKYNKLIRRSIAETTGDNRFPPELLGRIDCIVPFQPLSEATMKKIVEMKLTKLMNEVRDKHGIALCPHRKVIDYLVDDNLDTDSDSGGARTVMSKLESEVTTAVARFINTHPDVYKIGVIVEGEMRSDNKYQLESKAKIAVVPMKK